MIGGASNLAPFCTCTKRRLIGGFACKATWPLQPQARLSGVLSVQCELAFDMWIALSNPTRSGLNWTKLAAANYHASSDTANRSEPSRSAWKLL